MLFIHIPKRLCTRRVSSGDQRLNARSVICKRRQWVNETSCHVLLIHWGIYWYCTWMQHRHNGGIVQTTKQGFMLILCWYFLNWFMWLQCSVSTPIFFINPIDIMFTDLFQSSLVRCMFLLFVGSHKYNHSSHQLMTENLLNRK
jgi:hypothetical protein